MASTEPESAHRRPRAVVICGLPGVGKTTVAERVADRVDGTLLRTDVVRKELRPDPEYTDEEDRLVYDELLERARQRLAAGESVVLDGTFRDAEQRERARAVATGADAAFSLLRVECEEAVVKERIEAREDDASDADFDVHAQFRETFDPCSIDHVTVDNTAGLDQVAHQIEQHF